MRVDRYRASRSANPNRPHHAAGLAALLAIRKEDVRPAGSAQVGGGDVLREDASVEKLATVGFDEVKVDLRAEVAVPGSARGQKQHGIFLAHRVIVGNLDE